MKIPISEIQYLKNDILSKPEYLDPEYIISVFEKYALNVLKPDSSREICHLIINALADQKPYSVVRVGDGEINILTAYTYPETPSLDFQVAKEAIDFCEHTFITTNEWLNKLKRLTYDAVIQADIIGVLGLQRFNVPTVNQLATYLENHVRGVSGQHRGIDYMLRLARNYVFSDKIIASAFLYFSVLDHLNEILTATKKLVLITNKIDVYKKLCIKYPLLDIQLININPTIKPTVLKEPIFFIEVLDALDEDLSGTLTLIGAGIWSEFYCHEVKKRNGVAVDLGSGFDLLNSSLIRPLHRKMGTNRLNKYFL